MDRSRGWIAASTVAITLTLVLLAVEKHLRVPTLSFFRSAGSSQHAASTTAHRAIQLSIDPGLAGVEHFPASDKTPPVQRQPLVPQELGSEQLLRRPPEPATGVVLRAPVALDSLAFEPLPLHGQASSIDRLMDVMDRALRSPMQAASAQLAITEPPLSAARLERLASVPDPHKLRNRLPPPRRLFQDLADLQQTVSPEVGAPQPGKFTSTGEDMLAHSTGVSIATPGLVAPAEMEQISSWVSRTQELLGRVVAGRGLNDAGVVEDLHQLAELAEQATRIGNGLMDHHLAKQLLAAGYGLRRRIEVWQAVAGCLQESVVAQSATRDTEQARAALSASVQAVRQKLGATGDSAAWAKYLMLDELTEWVQSPNDIWAEGNALALSVLSRMRWQRLSAAQSRLLAEPEFQELAAHLLVWGRDPVDYTGLLTELEALEEDSISRVAGSLASSVQVLRLSQVDSQQLVADTLNNHYRNANIRLSLSEEIIQRALPAGQVEVRPVRRNILGADTAGDSAVRTELRVDLMPDPTGWSIGVGVQGNMVSQTRSSKGPAVFHNTSTAQIDSKRHVRLDPMGYQVAAQPTNVASQDYLRRMSTDFDGLPIIGDLARFLAREQFDQKRGLAKRISQRIIAQEADAEFDRQLQAKLANAENEIQQRLIGPLERLNLNPLVVSMNSTDDRLTIRYRVANEQQMAANTPRPRAPSDSLMSMQVHQSAINNTIAQLGLCGRTWTLAELYQRLGQAFGNQQWELPADVPEDITVRFADTRAATVEMADGRLRLVLRIAELRQGGRSIERFIVSSQYIPAADGLQAELIRDGVVEVISHPHDRIKLRFIFAKVFVSSPQIPLIAEAWARDPRSEGLAVSQVEIRDGWLAVAISHADSPQAAEVAARAQQLRLLK